MKLSVLYLYSEVTMLAIRLPQSIEKRLEKLARQHRAHQDVLCARAILPGIEELEDVSPARGAAGADTRR